MAKSREAGEEGLDLWNTKSTEVAEILNDPLKQGNWEERVYNDLKFFNVDYWLCEGASILSKKDHWEAVWVGWGGMEAEWAPFLTSWIWGVLKVSWSGKTDAEKERIQSKASLYIEHQHLWSGQKIRMRWNGWESRKDSEG